MNITEEIVKKLGLMGYPWKESTILKYFLDENIKGMFGSSIVDSNDIDFTLTSNAIDIECIFSEGHHVISVNYDQTNNIVNFKCDRVVNGENHEVFKITESPLSIENEFTSKDGIKKKYTYDKTKICFGLEISHMSCEEEKLDYKAYLSPVYAKAKGTDWFSYTQKYPPKSKEESFLKRIADEISGRATTRQIVTCKDPTIELEEFSENIFGNLLSDAKRVLENTETNEKKRIRF